MREALSHLETLQDDGELFVFRTESEAARDDP